MTGFDPTEPDLIPSIEYLRTDWNTRGEDIHWETAITLAEMSELAYTEPHNRELVVRLMGFDEAVILEDGSMSGLLAMTDDVAVVAFRGTDMLSPDDWLANFDFRERLDLGSDREVHRGFQNAYDRFADEIKTLLRRREPKRTWITGHSLGGAMATCCAYDWTVSRLPPSGLVTFGQPRVGNRSMARFIDDEIGRKYMRFVNECDPVPILPPGIGILLPPYWHCGARIRFRDGKLDRRSGVTLFSARGPGGDAVSGATPEDESNDGEETIGEEHFLALQKYLRATQPSETAFELPEGRCGEAPPQPFGADAEQPHGSATPQFGGWAESAFDSIRKRIGDHSMHEYLRQLNEFRQGDERR